MGVGTPKDLTADVTHYKIAADGGEIVAQGNLARLYRFGDGTPVDLASAACANSYAFLVSKGMGTKLDMSEAIKYFQKAIDAKEVRNE